MQAGVHGPQRVAAAKPTRKGCALMPSVVGRPEGQKIVLMRCTGASGWRRAGVGQRAGQHADQASL